MTNWRTEWLPRLLALAQNKHLAVLLTVLLVLLLAQGLARLTWSVLPATGDEDFLQAEAVLLSAPAQQTPQHPANANRVSVSQIQRLHLFGEARQQAVVKPKIETKDAPDTRLNLKLRGVLASDSATQARAIVADAKGKEDAYAVEDKLPGNALLKEIYPDRIILEYRGQLETLRLPKNAIKGAAGRITQHRGSALNTARTGALLRQYRDALSTDPQSVMDLLSAQPVRDPTTGRLKGYSLRPGRDRQLLGKFGLRTGDVVTSINGIPMDNPLKALELMRDISNVTQINLEIERNGTPQSFSFQIQ